jgi:DNA adenine methylase
MQLTLENKFCTYYPPRNQLLKWVGSKQKFATEITRYFPSDYNNYFEPFLGSGAILATVSPRNGLGSDVFKPLIDIWKTLKVNPSDLIEWYAERRKLLDAVDKKEVYEQIKASYNNSPNGPDFLFLSRSCYGGVIRFRKNDGYMSTPCGVHTPISVDSFTKRVLEWHRRVQYVEFESVDYRSAFELAKRGDLIYCDPPYSFSQAILYGAQEFNLDVLLSEIERAKSKGVMVALSIDGHKKSGNMICDIPIPDKLFEQEIFISLGSSMLKRFQSNGKKMINEDVSDRLLLTF